MSPPRAMGLRRLLLGLLAVSLPAAPPAAADAARKCEGKISGSAAAKFDCAAEILEKNGKYYFVLRPITPIEGVPTYQPGGFELPGAPAVRTYTSDDLVTGLATFPAENRTLFTASKTDLNRRGDVTLTLTSAKRDAKGGWAVRGSYRARLVPAGGGKTGEVLVEAKF